MIMSVVRCVESRSSGRKESGESSAWSSHSRRSSVAGEWNVQTLQEKLSLVEVNSVFFQWPVHSARLWQSFFNIAKCSRLRLLSSCQCKCYFVSSRLSFVSIFFPLSISQVYLEERFRHIGTYPKKPWLNRPQQNVHLPFNFIRIFVDVQSTTFVTADESYTSSMFSEIPTCELIADSHCLSGVLTRQWN